MSHCPICRTESVMIQKLKNIKSVYSMGKSFSILECSTCSTWITSPLLTNVELAAYYNSNYAYQVHHWVKREKSARARGLIKAAQIFKQNDHVIEIGTGGGELCGQLASMGVHVDGCDLDSKSVAKANLQSNVNIKCLDEDIYLKSLSNNQYDVAVLSHVLEHLLNPSATLKQISRVLKEGGKVVIVVPNRDARPKLFTKYWGYWQVPVHVSHHSLNSLNNLCSQAGFQIERVQYRNSDFMALGSFLNNFIGNDSKELNMNSKLLKRIVSLFSTLYSVTYRFGKQDLIAVASKTQSRI